MVNFMGIHVGWVRLSAALVFTVYYFFVNYRCISWLIRFRRRRFEFGFAQRKPGLITLSQLCLLVYLLSRAIGAWTISFKLNQNESIEKIILSSVNRLLLLTGFMTGSVLACLRSWLIYFDSSLAKENSDRQWVSLITAPVVYRPTIVGEINSLRFDSEHIYCDRISNHTSHFSHSSEETVFSIKRWKKMSGLKPNSGDLFYSVHRPHRSKHRKRQSKKLKKSPKLSNVNSDSEMSVSEMSSAVSISTHQSSILSHHSTTTSMSVDELISDHCAYEHSLSPPASLLTSHLSDAESPEMMNEPENWFIRHKFDYGNERWLISRVLTLTIVTEMIAIGLIFAPDTKFTTQPFVMAFLCLVFSFTLGLAYFFPKYTDSLQIVAELQGSFRVVFTLILCCLIYVIPSLIISKSGTGNGNGTGGGSHSGTGSGGGSGNGKTHGFRQSYMFWSWMVSNVGIVYFVNCFLLSQTKWPCLCFISSGYAGINGQTRGTNLVASSQPSRPSVFTLNNTTLNSTEGDSSMMVIGCPNDNSLLEIREISMMRTIFIPEPIQPLVNAIDDCFRQCWVRRRLLSEQRRLGSAAKSSSFLRKSLIQKDSTSSTVASRVVWHHRRSGNKSSNSGTVSGGSATVVTSSMGVSGSSRAPSVIVEEVDLKLNDILEDPAGFRLFMAALFNEFSYESLLCVIELQQFQERCQSHFHGWYQPRNNHTSSASHSRSASENHSSANTTPTHTPSPSADHQSLTSKLIRHHEQIIGSESMSSSTSSMTRRSGHRNSQVNETLMFPEMVRETRSSIVWDSQLSREQSFVILCRKYILDESEMPVNISFRTRRKLTDICDFLLHGTVPRTAKEINLAQFGVSIHSKKNKNNETMNHNNSSMKSGHGITLDAYQKMVQRLTVSDDVFKQAIRELIRLMGDSLTRFKSKPDYVSLKSQIIDRKRKSTAKHSTLVF